MSALFEMSDERTKDGYDIDAMAARSLDQALAHSHALLDRVIAANDPVAVIGLFSGGNDSTVGTLSPGPLCSSCPNRLFEVPA